MFTVFEYTGSRRRARFDLGPQAGYPALVGSVIGHELVVDVVEHANGRLAADILVVRSAPGVAVVTVNQGEVKALAAKVCGGPPVHTHRDHRPASEAPAISSVHR